MSLRKKLWLLGVFPGDKGCYIDVWDDQNYDQNKSNLYGCLLLSKVDNIQKLFVPEGRLALFRIRLLVCEFNPHRQTSYQ